MSTKKFLYVREDEIPSALKCKLCHQPFNDPVIAHDENRYCHSCIVQRYQSNASTTSLISQLVPVRDEIVYEMLGLLLVQCTECGQDDIKRAEIDQHHKKLCRKRIVACSAADLKCSWRGCAEMFSNHRSQCPYEPLRSALEIALNYSNEMATMKIQLDRSEEKRIKMENMLMALIEVSKRQALKIDDLQKRMDEQIEVQVKSEEKLDVILREQQLMNQERQEERQTIHELEKRLDEQREIQTRFQWEWEEKLKIVPTERQLMDQQRQEERRTLDDLQKRMDEQIEVQMKSEEKLDVILREQQLMNQERQEERQTIHELEKRLDEQREIQTRFQWEWEEKLKTVPTEQQSVGQIKPEERRTSMEDYLLSLKKQCDKHEFQISLISKKKTFLPDTSVNSDLRLSDFLYHLPSGRKLTVNRQTILNDDMHYICIKKLQRNQCDTFTLENSQQSIETMTILAESLINNEFLTELSLINNQLTDLSIHPLALTLANSNSALTSLDLRGNRLTNDSASYLADMLKINRTITFLGLAENEIGDQGVKWLAQAIANNNRILEVLSLSANRSITDVAVIDLIEMMRQGSSLKLLTIDGCHKISERARHQFLKFSEQKAAFCLVI